MSRYIQRGGVKCSLCGSEGTNKSSCPLNPQVSNPNPLKHPLAQMPNKSPVCVTCQKPTSPHQVSKQRSQPIEKPIYQRPSQSREISYVPVKIKKAETENGRLSARWYYDNYGQQKTIGDRCNIRRDGTYKCLLMRTNNSPYWAPPSLSGRGQEACEDWSSQCQDPDFK